MHRNGEDDGTLVTLPLYSLLSASERGSETAMVITFPQCWTFFTIPFVR